MNERKKEAGLWGNGKTRGEKKSSEYQIQLALLRDEILETKRHEEKIPLWQEERRLLMAYSKHILDYHINGKECDWYDEDL